MSISPRAPRQHEEPIRDETGTGGGGEVSALQQRLRTLIASERQGQELLGELLDQQLTAQQEDSSRRLAALEGTLAEARIEATKRAETEQVVGAMRAEASRLTNELEQAKQVAEDARNAEKVLVALRAELERQRQKIGELERLRKQHTETERRMAELEAELGLARGNVAQERAQRTELEQQLGQVRAGASRLAAELEQTRKAAEDARKARSKEARRIEEAESKLVELRAQLERERKKRGVLEQQVESLTTHEEHLGEAHEQKLAELERARIETERTAAEAQEALARERAEREREQRLEAVEARLRVRDGSEGSGREAPHNGPGAAESPARTVERLAEEPHYGTREAHHGLIDGVLRRRFRREPGRPPGNGMVACMVCNRTRSADEDEPGDWSVRADLGLLCPECQSEGWQLSEAGGLPFRRLRG
jgi:hypothetical protein